MTATADDKTVRIDKYLWAVRIYKTRNIAADECKKGRITINDVAVKPSRDVVAGEIITVKKPPINYCYKIIDVIENRISAKLVSQFIDDITSDEEKLKLNIGVKVGTFYRDKGTGRPTKKERRIIDRFQNEANDL
ncbi:MAG: RNA-binding S4 domain-containing protein [Bacteroidales bacterium]|jgi:ribosome-associated heat shock protein Hsp15|nr:RNA-binding S4 domain-containing protein [Bacteroidales bacterium]